MAHLTRRSAARGLPAANCRRDDLWKSNHPWSSHGAAQCCGSPPDPLERGAAFRRCVL